MEVNIDHFQHVGKIVLTEDTMDKIDNTEKLKAIMAVLGPMYMDHKPLLNYENPFQLLVATVLAMQCMDKLVNTVTPELFRRFPDPAALAAAPLGEVEKLLQPELSWRFASASPRSSWIPILKESHADWGLPIRINKGKSRKRCFC